MNQATPSKTDQFKQNAADFTIKHGMKACSAIYILGNLGFLGQNFWHPEACNVFKNFIAPSLQLCTNYYMINNKKTKAYDFATGGSASFFIGNILAHTYFTAATFFIFGQATYQKSDWPKRIKQCFKKKDSEPVLNPELAVVETLVKPKQPKKTIINQFIDNNLSLLKEPHARAGTIAFLSSMGHVADAAIHEPSRLPMTILSLIAGSIYMSHGLLSAQQDKKALRV